MKRTRKLPYAIGSILAIVLTSAVLAQISTNFDLRWWVVSSGGARQSTNFRIDDSLGALGDVAVSGNYRVESGFAGGASTPSPTPTRTPTTANTSTPTPTRTPTTANTSTPTPTRTPTTANTNTPTATNTPPTVNTSTPTPTRTATPTTVPTSGDSFEIDDTCAQAKSINSDGSGQSHNFHLGSDVDWVKFTAQANKTYIIQVENIGAKADAVIFLHDTCASDPATSGNNAFGSTVRLEWDSVKNGDYFIRLQQFDSTFFGAEANYTISVTVDNMPPSAPTNPRCISIDATTVGVQWRKSLERDVRKYRISYGTAGGPLSNVDDVDGAETTYYQVGGLTTGVTYAFLVRALDFSTNSSPPSGEVQCTAQIPADLTLPSLVIQQPTSSATYTTTAEKITLTGLASDSGNNLSRVRVQNLTKGGEKWDYTLSGASDTWRVEDMELGAGDNSLRVTVYDAAGNSGQQNILVKRLGNSPGAVILIAGRNETSGLQTNIYNSTNRAYRIFKSAGFTDDDIFYLAPVAQDPDKNGVADEVDATASPAAFQQAITVWAKTRVGPSRPLFIYMMDHGFANKFCVSGCTGANSITPDEMDGWLTTLESESGVTEVTVVYEACLSGSFIHRVNPPGDSISKPGRVIITSTGFNNNAYASAQGAYFSDAFFSCVADSENLKVCFDQAKAAVTTTGVNQTPFLDDNGDGVYNAGDGTFAVNRYVTRFFSSVRPVIEGADVQRSGADGVLTASVAEGAEQTELVWAAIYGSTFEEPAEVTINLNVPVLKLEPVAGQPGKYSVNYTNGFLDPGDYRIVFYAQDRLGLNAIPVSPGGIQLFLPTIRR
ncbi:MAG: fibronectin type III domain-containing protein [Chloroflexi bacterium]|nr:fibronectin type III domain-containing protein [Chloroflexota bacterium]